MLNMHEIFNLKIDSLAAVQTIELGFTPTEVSIMLATGAAEVKWVAGMAQDAGITLEDGGEKVFYNDGTVPTYKDKDGNAVANAILDLDGNSVLDRYLPKISVADNGNAYVKKPSLVFTTANLTGIATSDTVIIRAKR